jgi:transglutaminase-like putative cysteine protease
LDFDPTNDCMVGEDHVTLAWGRDFGDVSPLRGMIVGGGRHKLKVDVSVQPM